MVKQVKKQNPRKRKETAKQRLIRYALVGGALGLYFGLFFRPLRQPSPLLVVGLALVVAILMLVLRLIRGERPTLTAALKSMAVTFLKTALFLAVMEGRHIAYNLGGKPAVVIMTTTMGVLAGVWSARHKLW